MIMIRTVMTTIMIITGMITIDILFVAFQSGSISLIVFSIFESTDRYRKMYVWTKLANILLGRIQFLQPLLAST